MAGRTIRSSRKPRRAVRRLPPQRPERRGAMEPKFLITRCSRKLSLSVPVGSSVSKAACRLQSKGSASAASAAAARRRQSIDRSCRQESTRSAKRKTKLLTLIPLPRCRTGESRYPGPDFKILNSGSRYPGLDPGLPGVTSKLWTQLSNHHRARGEFVQQDFSEICDAN